MSSQDASIGKSHHRRSVAAGLLAMAVLAQTVALLTTADAATASQNGGGAAQGPEGEAEQAVAEGSVRGNHETSIPIEVPSNHGVEPQLALRYDSAGENGWVGVGWSLSGLSFVRRTSAGQGSPNYDENDVFRLDGVELLPCQPDSDSPSCSHAADASLTPYTSKIESFRRIAFDPASHTWLVWSKEGIKTTYEPHLVTSAGILDWHVARVEDALGNSTEYRYFADELGAGSLGVVYPNEIRYNGSSVWIHWEQRPDTFTQGQAPSLTSTRLRVRTIDVSSGNQRVRAYALRYEVRGASTSRSFLSEVQQYGRDAVLDSGGAITGGTALAPTRLRGPEGGAVDQWGALPQAQTAWAPPWPDARFSGFTGDVPVDPQSRPWRRQQVLPADLNGDGRTDYVAVYLIRFEDIGGKPTYFYLRGAIANADGTYRHTPLDFNEQPTDWLWTHDPGLDFFRVLVGDVSGDGKDDVLVVMQNTERPTEVLLRTAISHENATFRFRPAAVVPVRGFNPLARWFVRDTTGDAIGDLMVAAPSTVPNHATLAVGTLDGKGQFVDFREQETPWSYDVWDVPHWFVGDANNDAKADFVRIVNHGWDEPGKPFKHAAFQVALSKGNGNFQLGATFETSIPWSTYRFPIPGMHETIGTDLAQAGDFNGDGRIDFAFMKELRNENGANRRIGISTAFSAGVGAFDVRSHDTVNVSSQLLNYVVYRCEGEQACDESGRFPNRWFTGDFNGDGATDLAVAAPSRYQFPATTNLTSLISTRDGNYEATTEVTDWSHDCFANPDCVNDTVTFPLAGDVNGDGRSDAMYAGYRRDPESGRQSVRLLSRISAATGFDMHSWRDTDLNGDGRQDLVYVYPMRWGVKLYTLLRQPDGSYTPRTVEALSHVPNPIARAFKLGDVDGDGQTDLIYAYNSKARDDPGLIGFELRVETLFSNGDGTWRPGCDAATDDCERWLSRPNEDASWVPADVNGDGRTDLVHVSALALGGDLIVTTLLSNGDGQWTLHSRRAWPYLEASDVQNFKVADVNGDAKADLVHLSWSPIPDAAPLRQITVHTLTSAISGTSGTWKPKEHATGQPFPSGDTSAWRVMRANGDNKADLVHVMPPLLTGDVHVRTLVGLGDGTWSVASYTAEAGRTNFAPPGAGALADVLNWKIADINRDGTHDFVHPHYRDGKTYVTSFVSLANGRWRPMLSQAPDGVPRDLRWHITDADGNGQDELRRLDHVGGVIKVMNLASTAPTDLLVEAVSPTGATTKIVYEPSSHSPVRPRSGCGLPMGVVVQAVASVTVGDGRGVEETTDHSYGCARWSRSERTFVGWESVAVVHREVANRPTSTVTTAYEIFDEGLVRPASVTRTEPDTSERVGTVRDEVHFLYKPVGSVPLRSLVAARRQVQCDQECVAHTTTFAYDAFGNTASVHELGADTADDQERISVRQYRVASGPFLMGHTGEEQIIERRGGADRLVQKTRWCYDGNDPTDCSAVPTRGLATAAQRFDDQKNRWVTMTFEYDAFGNQIKVVDANGHATITRYDDERHLYPVEECNALAHCTVKKWDMVLGAVLKEADANGGVSTVDYDALGRPVRATAPNGLVTRHQYLDWGDARRQRVRSSADDGSDSGLWTEVHLDGLGRTHRTMRKGVEDERPSMQEIVYSDDSARPHRKTRWFFEGHTPGYEEFLYDARGRPRRQTHPDSTHRAWSYAIDATSIWVTTTDELGRGNSVARSVFGTTRTVVERTGNAEARTHHEYDALDRLVRTEDAAGNTTAIVWGSLGNKVSHEDPDLGKWTYVYDDAGNLTAQTDARGITTESAYDAIDRPVTRRSSGGIVTWRYDEPGRGASTGRLTSVHDPTGEGCPEARSESMSYDSVGQLTIHDKCVLGVNYRLKFTYDKLGRQVSIVYPDGEEVRSTYDGAGRLSRVSNYVDAMTYGAAGEMLSAKLSNGTEETNSYDPNRGWLTESRVLKDRNTLFDAAYRYEANGLPRTASSTTNATGLTFGYDSLNRLISVTGDVAETFEYDRLGNVAFRSTVGRYTYPSARPSSCGGSQSCAGPHAVTHAGGETLEYDANGNLVMRTDATGGQRRITWNADNRPERFTGGGTEDITMRYDPSGARVVKQVGRDTARFWGRLLEATPDKKLVKYYFAGEKLVAKRIVKEGTDKKDKDKKETSKANVFWYHTDALRSTRAVTDEKGVVTSRMNYRPFGEEEPVVSGPGRPAQVGEPISFTGHYGDTETGLVFMNARYYDPKLARFISADTVVPDALDPQALNRYSYVRNTPTLYSDPTGHSPEDPQVFATLCCEEIIVRPPPDWEPQEDNAYQEPLFDIDPTSEPDSSGVGAPSFGWSLVPIVGDGWQALHEFQTGHWGWGTFHAVMAVSDVFLVKSAVNALRKGVWKAGSHSWRATRAWMAERWQKESGTEFHHWLLQQHWVKYLPAQWRDLYRAISNQPWNLVEVDWFTHRALHHWSTTADVLWYGTPTWFKETAVALTGRSVEYFVREPEGS